MLKMSLYLQQFTVLGVTLLLVIMLFLEKIKPAILFFFAVLIFILTGVVSVQNFLESLANESILSIFLLLCITAGLREHFDIAHALDKLFGKTASPRKFMLRMASFVASVSAFMENTPLVALMMPYVYQWSIKNKVAPSKFLIPLSYAVVSGGMITVIGTSTNMVLNGLIESKHARIIGPFDFFIPGFLVTIAGVIFLYLFGDKLLPSHENVLNSVAKQTREYLIETKIAATSSLVGCSISDARLRNLTGIYLFEIVRNGMVITPVGPDEILMANDSLFFAGETDDIMVLLDREKELAIPTALNDGEKKKKDLELVETVIPINSNLVGKTLKQLKFRENYDAAVVAIHRNGEKLRGKIGEIVMQAGDLLLISIGSNFYQLLAMRPNLYLVSEVSKTTRTSPIVRKGFLVTIAVVIVTMCLGYAHLFLALLMILSYMGITGLVTIQSFKNEFDINLLIILIASLTFSRAIIDTGSAELVANKIIPLFNGLGNAGIVIGLYIVTILLTTFVTHVATVSIVFPIAYAIGTSVHNINPTALFVTIAFAASASFHAPFSYQTNLMVYGPGGYKFKDYLKIGIPFTLVYSVITLVFVIFYYKV